MDDFPTYLMFSRFFWNSMFLSCHVSMFWTFLLVPCFSSADWHTRAHFRGKALNLSLDKSLFFVEPVMYGTIEGRFPFCPNKSTAASQELTPVLMLWFWRVGQVFDWRVELQKQKEWQVNITGASLLYHSYQYKQCLISEIARKVTSSWTFLT